MCPQRLLQAGKSEFEIYLRTGVVLASTDPSLALKYNPWHDIEDGRFTRADMGRKFPPKFGGFGSGRSGAGGASEPWDTTEESGPRPNPKRSASSVNSPPIPSSAAKPQRDDTVQTAPPTSPVVETLRRNGYAFGVDAQFRTRQITGTLTNGPRSKRSRSMQTQAGKPERLPSDDGGHYIATRFNGPPEKFNHFAQDSNVNRGRYRALEDQWSRDIAGGKVVTVDIRPRFNRGLARPFRIDVIWHTNNVKQSIKVPNVKGN